MITIKVTYIGLAARDMGTSEEEVRISTPTLRELWTVLAGRHGEMFLSLASIEGEASPYVVLLNGRNVRLLNGPDAPLQEGDRVTVMAPFAGGCIGSGIRGGGREVPSPGGCFVAIEGDGAQAGGHSQD